MILDKDILIKCLIGLSVTIALLAIIMTALLIARKTHKTLFKKHLTKAISAYTDAMPVLKLAEGNVEKLNEIKREHSKLAKNMSFQAKCAKEEVDMAKEYLRSVSKLRHFHKEGLERRLIAVKSKLRKAEEENVNITVSDTCNPNKDKDHARLYPHKSLVQKIKDKFKSKEDTDGNSVLPHLTLEDTSELQKDKVERQREINFEIESHEKMLMQLRGFIESPNLSETAKDVCKDKYRNVQIELSNLKELRESIDHQFESDHFLN